MITYSSYTNEQEFDGALAVADSFGEIDAPVHLVAGDAGGKSYIDLELLREWHANA